MNRTQVLAGSILIAAAIGLHAAEGNSSTTADSPTIKLSQWTGPSQFTTSSQIEIAGQKMRMEIPYMTFKTNAEIVSRSREKKSLKLTIPEGTLKALKALTPDLEGFDPFVSFSEGNRVLQEGILEIGPGETKSITLWLGIHQTAYGKLGDTQKKEFKKLCHGANLEAT